MQRLHSISVDEGFRLGAPNDEIGRLAIPRRTQQIRDYLDLAKKARLIDEVTRWDHVIDAAQNAQARETCLCHGDLYARHLLIGQARESCGVIDWGDVHVGDPAGDLAIVHEFLPPRRVGAFF